jgi:carbonic anhydrase
MAGVSMPWLIGAAVGDQGSAAPEAPPRTGAESLARLKAGNQRFAEGRVRHAHQAAAWRSHLTSGQAPFATILACSDSRVPPELVFDQGFGDLFVVRVAGNVVASDVVGSIQYAIAHLHTPLILVLGHEGCGAVTTAVESLAGKGTDKKFINLLVDRIKPGLADLPSQLEGPELINRAVEANVRWTMRQLTDLPDARRALESQVVTLVGAVYELATGTVRFLDPSAETGKS